MDNNIAYRDLLISLDYLDLKVLGRTMDSTDYEIREAILDLIAEKENPI